MNKWNNSFKEAVDCNKSNSSCICSHNEGLFIPNRQLSFIVALLFLIAFTLFIGGYFLGKKKVIQEFTQNLHEEAVADQIYTTMLSSVQDELDQSSNKKLEEISHISTELTNDFNNTELSEKPNEQHYYAQLIGFGTEKAAQSFVKKLATKGIETTIKKRISKTVKGHTSYWYQVVTTMYTNKNDLTLIVNKIVKEENIKGVCICCC